MAHRVNHEESIRQPIAPRADATWLDEVPLVKYAVLKYTGR